MNNNDDKISIIVPVYNVEPYLSRCIESILNQSYKNIELILIDDGSKDKSGLICDDYSKKDDRCKVYHKDNAGVSVARNYGLTKATGSWIGFVDSDDWIDVDTYEIAMREALEREVDLVQWQISTFSDNGLRRDEDNIISDFFDLNNKIEFCRPNSVTMLIRKTIIQDNNIWYPENARLSEDRLFTFKCYLYSSKCFHIGKCFYHYYMRSNSASHTITVEMIKEEIDVINQIKNIVLEQKKELLESEWLYNQMKDVKIHLILSLEKPNLIMGRSIFPEINKKLVKEHSKFGFVYFFVYYRLNLFSRILISFWKFYSKYHHGTL